MLKTIFNNVQKKYGIVNQRRACSSTRKDFAIRHLSPGVGRLTDIEMVSGKGSWLYTSHGNKYLDYTCGIGVTNLGHCHPRIVSAIQDQASKLIHAQVNISWHKPMLDLLEKFREITPRGLDTFFFWGSGAEAVEASIKLARHATKKQNIIAFNGGFHGRTFGTMPLTTTKTIYRAGFGPLLSGVYITTYPYLYHARQRYGDNYTEEQCVKHALEDLDLLLKTQSSPSETAAILIEPVLGEGGYIPAPPSFLQALRELTKKNNILLITDEVQSGFGRTGKYFALEYSNIIPDIVIFAKGVASGMPLSGIISTKELMSCQPPGSMGGTYAGNAISCSAAIATLDVFKEENILQNAQERSKQFFEGLNKMKKKYPRIGDVRGLGLMIGIEFCGGEPINSKVAQYCQDMGMLLLTCSVFDTIRFIPPLTTTKEEVDLALSIFEKAVEKASSS